MLWERWSSEWRLKAALSALLTVAFWLVYYWAERRPVAHVLIVPASALDRALPLVPVAAWIYLSQFATAPLILCLAASRRAVLAVAAGVALMASFSFLAYFLLPTTIDRAVAATSTDAAYGLVVGWDQPRNACPSLHAGFAIFLSACAWALSRGFRHRAAGVAAFWLWALAVLLSTLLIRQHVAIDLAAGAVVGAFSFWSIRSQL